MIFSHDDVLNMLRGLQRYEINPLLDGETIAVSRPVFTADKAPKGDFVLAEDIDTLIKKVEKHRDPDTRAVRETRHTENPSG